MHIMDRQARSLVTCRTDRREEGGEAENGREGDECAACHLRQVG
jgi:hypothetical protein